MLPRDIFLIDMALGYLAWALIIATYAHLLALWLLLRSARASVRSADALRSLAATE